MNILVVDDSQKFRSLLKSILGKFTDNFYEAEDGKDAVDLAEILNPDLILLDFMMKNMNGLDAAALIIKQNPKAKIIMLSNFHDDSIIEASLSAGIMDFYKKEDLYHLQEFVKQTSNNKGEVK